MSAPTEKNVFEVGQMACPFPNQIFVPATNFTNATCVCSPGWTGPVCNFDAGYFSSLAYFAYSNTVFALCVIGLFMTLYEVVVSLRKGFFDMNMFYFSRICTFGLFACKVLSYLTVVPLGGLWTFACEGLRQ